MMMSHHTGATHKETHGEKDQMGIPGSEGATEAPAQERGSSSRCAPAEEGLHEPEEVHGDAGG